MTWNYRVLRKQYVESGITQYSIHEVYYDEDGEIKGWTADPVEPHGETLVELKEDLTCFIKALEKPVLVENEVDGKEKLMISPFDVAGLKTETTTQDILDAVRESRDR